MTEEELFIVDGFTWSFSRLESFYQCPYAWYKTYIDCVPRISGFYAQYGSLCHKLLEEYIKGDISIFEISSEYAQRFDTEITAKAPYNKYTDIRESYFQKGQNYFDNIDLDLDNKKILGTEEKVNFDLYNKPFVGFIDLRYVDKDGTMVISDHKSASIGFKKKGGVATKDKDKMLKYTYQLYLYSIPFVESGTKIDYLEWNFFNDRRIYRIPWDKSGYEEAKQWACDTIDLIESESEWAANPDWYKCAWICDHRDICPYKESAK